MVLSGDLQGYRGMYSALAEVAFGVDCERCSGLFGSRSVVRVWIVARPLPRNQRRTICYFPWDMLQPTSELLSCLNPERMKRNFENPTLLN